MTANNIPESPTPSQTQTPEPAVIARVLIPEQDIVYRNEIAGYQITFPEHWRGYYVVTEYREGTAIIGFYGNSYTGQNGDRHHTKRDGLDMFWIVTNPHPDMGAIKIGEINGVEYFYARPGGIPSPVLVHVLDPDDWWREFAERELGYKFDKEELALVAEDKEKFIQILHEDLWNAEDVIFPTFKAIE